MTLYDFILQMGKTAGDGDADKFSIATMIQYINEEVSYVSREFPEKATFELVTTSAGYYHTLDFTGYPVVAVDNIMVGGVGATKKRWKDLKGRIGNDI